MTTQKIIPGQKFVSADGLYRVLLAVTDEDEDGHGLVRIRKYPLGSTPDETVELMEFRRRFHLQKNQ